MVIRTILPKRRNLSAHFGVKYLSNDGIDRYLLFHRKNFPKIHTFRPAKKCRANFEWSVPVIVDERLTVNLQSLQDKSGKLQNNILLLYIRAYPYCISNYFEQMAAN